MSVRTSSGDLGQLQEIFAKEFSARAADAVSRRGKFVLALTGGSVAPAFFPTLASLAVDWSRSEIFWGDERAVPPDHPDSNYRLARQLLLSPAGIPASCIHRLKAELPDLDDAARLASDELLAIAGDPPELDVAILGVGADGHVASIFDTAGIESCAQGVIPVYNSPKPPPRRLTLTFPVLARARLAIIIALGAEKAPAMRAALDGSGTTPVAELLRRARSALVLLDHEAAILLAGSW